MTNDQKYLGDSRSIVISHASLVIVISPQLFCNCVYRLFGGVRNNSVDGPAAISGKTGNDMHVHMVYRLSCMDSVVYTDGKSRRMQPILYTGHDRLYGTEERTESFGRGIQNGFRVAL